MKNIALALWLVALSVLSVGAQPLAIQDHPQKTQYASQAEWPFLSDQCHWLVNGVLAHTHVEMTAPIYAVLTPGSRIDIPIQFKLFHTAGRISTVWSELGNVTFTSIHPADNYYPNIQGDPSGVITVTGVWHFNSAAGNASGAGPFGVNPHGWTVARVMARTEFPDGSKTDAGLGIPFYSMLDPTKPEAPMPEDRGREIQAICAPTSPRDQSGVWGQMTVEFRQTIPIATLAFGEVWNPPVLPYSYAATPFLQIGTIDRRLDADLHNGIVGMQLSGATFDTNLIGLGAHHVSYIWDVKSGAGAPGVSPNEEAAALLVVYLNVGDGTGTPPPPPPPPPPTPCAAGDSGVVVIDGFTFKVTVDANCVPSVTKL
jgi:hypothetical protein